NLVCAAGPAAGERDADRSVGELVDVGGIEAIAVFVDFGIQPAEVRIDSATADRDDLLPMLERTNGAEVDSAGDALTDDRRHRRLVDIDLTDDLGRVLVIFDSPVVARRGLFTP